MKSSSRRFDGKSRSLDDRDYQLCIGMLYTKFNWNWLESVSPLSPRAMRCALPLKEFESPYLKMFYAKLSWHCHSCFWEGNVKSRNFVIISLASCKGARSSICIHINSIDPIGMLCYKFGWNCPSFSSMWKIYDNEKTTNKQTMPGNGISS